MQMSDGSFALRGTAFFYGREVDGHPSGQVWLVTARHVIERIRGTGVPTSFIRVNASDGTCRTYNVPFDDWHWLSDRPDIDVAAAFCADLTGVDHLAVPRALAVDAGYLQSIGVELGDEVAIVGLFKHHHGIARNIPIVRIGALACRSEERVSTEMGPMDLLLIEARSIGGLSGSPVFHLVPPIRILPDRKHVTLHPTLPARLLGLCHGHFDETDEGGKVNTGIALVVPIENVEKVIDAASAGLVPRAWSESGTYQSG